MTSTALKSTLRFLSIDQVKKLHQNYIGTTAPSRDTLLNSALDAPMNIQHYEGEQDVVKLASVLATRIIKNHAFMDGNKRTALLAANMFLKINGKMLHEEPLDAQDVRVRELLEAAHSAVAVNELDEAGLAEEYNKVVVASSVTTEIEKMREEADE
ncbi:MAG: hypothetical protein Q9221_004643 [Calogaya cf. arnoldii]